MLGIVLCFAVVVAAGFAFRWLLIQRHSRVAVEDRCAKCGYIVVGLPSSICPECGSNLAFSEAVIRGGTRRSMRREVRILLWSIVFWTSFAAINSAWLNRVPYAYFMEMDRHFREPHSKAYDNVTLTYRGEMFRRQPISGKCELTLTANNGQKGTLEVDGFTGSYKTVSGPSIIQGDHGFGKDAILQWMHSFGVNVSSPLVITEANSIALAMRDAATRGSLASHGGFSEDGGSSSAYRRTLYAVIAGLCGMVLIWLLGCGWLWRRTSWV